MSDLPRWVRTAAFIGLCGLLFYVVQKDMSSKDFDGQVFEIALLAAIAAGIGIDQLRPRPKDPPDPTSKDGGDDA